MKHFILMLTLMVLSAMSMFHSPGPVRGSTAAATAPDANGLVVYTGTVPHVFFHSLIVYPRLAQADAKRRELFVNNMVTVDEFRSILDTLYRSGFVLVDQRSLYAVQPDGRVVRMAVKVPQGKKPLVLSLDDVNYYTDMRGDGMADKLVLVNGVVMAQVTDPSGVQRAIIDGDVIPMVDAFIREHPDFSYNGARGIIGLTGYDGILGYRTEASNPENQSERAAVAPLVSALKAEGWTFANHSYNHDRSYLRGDISTTTLALDIDEWKQEVEPLVGPTDLYIGPFGQVFSGKDPRRAELLAAGYKFLFGVGLDDFEKDYGTYVLKDRVDIDGYRLIHDLKALHALFGASL